LTVEASSRAPEEISSSIAPALACIWAVLSSARWTAIPTSPISSEIPENASLIRVCASAAVYVALMVSLRVRNDSTLACSRCDASVSFSSSPCS
jgi:heterodisulfide reductase subunit A-like polyferredoxin